MEKGYDIKVLDAKIRELRKAAEETRNYGGGIEAVRRNADRILASVRMIELNLCDVTDIL